MMRGAHWAVGDAGSNFLSQLRELEHTTPTVLKQWGPFSLVEGKTDSPSASPGSWFHHVLSHLQLVNNFHFRWQIDMVILKLHYSANLLFSEKHCASRRWIHLKCSDTVIGQGLSLNIHLPSLPQHICIYSTWISQNTLEVTRSEWHCYDNGA